MILPPTERMLLKEFRVQGKRGLSAMDAMRVLGIGGASFTKRVSVLRRSGLSIVSHKHVDPFTGRSYSRYVLQKEAEKA